MHSHGETLRQRTWTYGQTDRTVSRDRKYTYTQTVDRDMDRGETESTHILGETLKRDKDMDRGWKDTGTCTV